MKIKWCYLLIFVSHFLKAQVYAPDTTFRFQNATFEIPSYQFLSRVASTSHFTLANILLPTTDFKGSYNSVALLDSSGVIITQISDGQYIPNSLTDNGFLTISYYNYTDSTRQAAYFDIKTRQISTFSLKHKKSSFEVIRVENDCIITRENYTIFNIYNSKGQLISTSNNLENLQNAYAATRHYVQEVRVDTEHNTWFLVTEQKMDTVASLQLYKLKPNQILDKDKLIFTKTDKELGTLGGFIGGYASFFGDTILFKRIKSWIEPRELLMLDLKGNILPKKIELPLYNNDPNSNYDFVSSRNSTYIVLRINQYNLFIIDPKGATRSLALEYTSLYVENDKIYYTDKQYKPNIIDLNTLKEVSIEREIPVITSHPNISHIQTLDNGDYWIGYRNPYTFNHFFIKYHRSKEAFRYEKEVRKLYYLTGNSVLVQANDGEKAIIDEQNKVRVLSKIEGTIASVDSANKHIYTNTNDNNVYRYDYDENQDLTFNWKGEWLQYDIVVSDNKKIYYKGQRFDFNGKLDTTFEPLLFPNDNNPYGGHFFLMKRIWNSLVLINGYCSEGCWGETYQWEQNEDKTTKIQTNIYDSFGKYMNSVRRDSLLLTGFDKILPNLKKDTSFIVKGEYTKEELWNTANRFKKTIDILPNHDLLVVLDNQLYRFSTKNNVWVEIRNLQTQIVLTDSLMKNGLPLDIFSSDGSEVKLTLINRTSSFGNTARLEGKKLFFEGIDGSFTLAAQSVKGGQPFSITCWTNTAELKSSIISSSLNNSSLYVDFKPFSFTYSVDIDVPLSIKVEGTSGYLKDGMIFSTGQVGYIQITISHKATLSDRANQATYYIQVNKYPQRIFYRGSSPVDNVFKLFPSDFPFKIPLQTSANLPLEYSQIDKNDFALKLFHLSQDTIYLNPDYKNILKDLYLSQLSSEVQITISTNQAGNNLFTPIWLTFGINLDYWTDELAIPQSNIFPNPFNDFFYIATQNGELVKEAFLYSLAGKKIMDLQADENGSLNFGFISNQKKKQASLFHTESILSGNYLLVFYVNGKKESKMLIK